MITIFVEKMVAEKDVLVFCEEIIGQPIDSFSGKNPDSPFFFQYENYDGEFKVMISISVNPNERFKLNIDEISKQISCKYSSKVLFELDESVDNKHYKVYYADGFYSYVNITDSEDGISILN